MALRPPLHFLALFRVFFVFHYIILHRLKYLHLRIDCRKKLLNSRGCSLIQYPVERIFFSLWKQTLMIRNSKSQKLRILRSSAGSAAISLIAAWGGGPWPLPVSPTEFADHHILAPLQIDETEISECDHLSLRALAACDPIFLKHIIIASFPASVL